MQVAIMEVLMPLILLELVEEQVVLVVLVQGQRLVLVV
jgi:hypothetical protein